MIVSSSRRAVRFRLLAVFAVLWVGLDIGVRAAVLGMQIESVQTQGETITVVTTGARFVFDEAQDTILCCQRIPAPREVATINGLGLKGLAVRSRTDQQCALGTTQGRPSLSVAADGLLTLSLAAGAQVGITGHYAPAYRGIQGNNLFLPDASGGVAVYLVGSGACTTPASWNPGWTVNCRAHAASQLLVSVYPPRPWDQQQASRTMVHSFSCKQPYPSDRELESWSRIGPVLTLHSWIWQGTSGSAYGIEQDNSWGSSSFVAKDPAELRRVVKTAHRLGMKVIPYLSPYYFGNPNGGVGKDTLPAYLKGMRSVLSQYGFDGVFMDGLYKDDILGSYELMRQARRIIGDAGILHIHTTDIPLLVPCPFIDTYTTYSLSGEHHHLLNADYARWIISKYNLGNSIGTFCYDTDRPTSQMIDMLLSNGVRLPYWVADGTWTGLKYHLTDEEARLMRKAYFPKLRALTDSPAGLPSR